jgi:hypothetical protein
MLPAERDFVTKHNRGSDNYPRERPFDWMTAGNGRMKSYIFIGVYDIFCIFPGDELYK